MTDRPVRSSATRLGRLVPLAAAILLASTTAAHAGGQQISAEVAPDGKGLLVRTYRCGTPASLSLTGTAEGLVNGQRRQIPLKMAQVADSAVFSVAQQWPGDGAWVLTFTAAGERSASAIVELAAGPKLKIASQESRYAPAALREVEAVLARMARR
jgi:hypothetical protein